MSLTAYKSRRNFKGSPEPRSVKKPLRKHKLTFVVHKHDARQLHYDFRLEMDDVLKSWAIPKGPSMVAGEKRMAIMVEDHPLEYGKFYGVIPEGNYGAGTVEIWDKGTYKPSQETANHVDILREMLGKGDLKISLDGSYLKGRFALFQLKGAEKRNEWLLVKKADEFAEDSFDIETIKPVKSKGISKAGTSAKENAPDPFPEPLPQPMLTKLSEKVVDKPGWIYETKLDGYRIVCSVKDGNVKLVSRNGKLYNDQFKVLLNDLGKIGESIILDGEVVVENSKGRSDFHLLQEYTKTRRGNLRYYVFDILYLSGHSLMGFSLHDRKDLLSSFFGKYQFDHVLNLESRKGGGKKLFEDLARRGFEGIIAKDPASSYLAGKRSDSWLKVKAVHKQEAIICGYTSPRGSRKYFGSILLGLFEEGRLKYIGNCGTGFDDNILKSLHAIFKHYETDTSPFRYTLKLSGAKGKPVWLNPKLVASIKFLEWTADGIMRHPVFMGLRDDKQPEDVINELKEGNSVTGNPQKEKTVELYGKKVKLTNLSKVFWKEEGYTKGDLIAYYQSINKLILPYLKDRPQSLNRYPGGIDGESFYHKDMDPEMTPKWIKTVRMQSGSHPEGINYLICNNAATLLYMVNLGCIEVNPWHSTYKNPNNPTYLILDLDPGKISFKEVVNTALVIKEICDETGIPCYPKTSGSSGMHLYIPLGEKYDYDQARTLAEIIAIMAHRRLPSVTSLERPVARREDKVYIDYLQNRKGQTIAVAYSVRPRPLATVSTPLSWKEVNHALSPEMFNMKNAQKRFEKVGELWQPVLRKGISIAKALKSIEKLS